MTVKFLCSIIIHNENKELFKDILDELSCDILIDEMRKIFKTKILKKEDSLFLGSPPLSIENESAISTAFSIYIILTILKENVPGSSKLNKFEIHKVQKSQFEFISIESKQKQVSQKIRDLESEKY